MHRGIIGTRFTPPSQLHSIYYPLSGPYSSRDINNIKQQFNYIKDNDIDVVIISWWGRCDNPSSSDTQGVCTDNIVPLLFQAADEVGHMKIAFHLEPYAGRSVASVRDDLVYIIDKYSKFASFYRSTRDGNKPLFYVYDSYHIAPEQWAELLSPTGNLSVRSTPHDGVFMGLWLDRPHGQDLSAGHFDGIYTYFAADGFSYGSTSSNWGSICDYCRREGLICDLSVGPGYQDDKIRPWNSHNTHGREDGAYYDRHWQLAIGSNSDVSFRGEGSGCVTVL